jgi:hypothetical protein
VRNIFIIIQSPNRFVSMGCASAFTLLSPSNMTYPVLSNQGESTLPTPFVGGGLTGPAGDRTMFIGEPGVSSFWYNYNIADEPVYNISFANSDVYIQDIGYATLSPYLLPILIYRWRTPEHLPWAKPGERPLLSGWIPNIPLPSHSKSCMSIAIHAWVNQTRSLTYALSPWPAPWPQLCCQIS